jgi:arylsulfatase A-like enzyme
VRAPGRIEPGRESRPVSTLDLFPTLLELSGLTPPGDTRARSLLDPQPRRARLAEDPSSATVGIDQVRALHPGFDATPFQRRLRAWTDLPWKYVWSSDGRHALFDLAGDPRESRNLHAGDAETAARLAADLEAYRAGLRACAPGGAPPAELSPEERERLRALGYAAPEPAP